MRDKEDKRQTVFQVDTERQGHFEVPCTLYVGTGKLWTEEDVVRIVERIRNNVYFMDRDQAEEFIREVAKDNNITLTL